MISVITSSRYHTCVGAPTYSSSLGEGDSNLYQHVVVEVLAHHLGFVQVWSSYGTFTYSVAVVSYICIH